MMTPCHFWQTTSMAAVMADCGKVLAGMVGCGEGGRYVVDAVAGVEASGVAAVGLATVDVGCGYGRKHGGGCGGSEAGNQEAQDGELEHDEGLSTGGGNIKMSWSDGRCRGVCCGRDGEA